MRGFCKCDLCGSLYNETENVTYSGITVWWKNKDGENRFPMYGDKLFTQNGEPIDDMAAVMDICPNCFQQFYNWIRIIRNNSDFPINKPE